MEANRQESGDREPGCGRITATPGTPEYDRQFDEQVEESKAQAQRTFDSFDITRYPVVRWFVRIFVVLSAGSLLIESYQRGELSLKRLAIVLVISLSVIRFMSPQTEKVETSS